MPSCGAFDTVPAGSDESALAPRLAHALHENIALRTGTTTAVPRRARPRRRRRCDGDARGGNAARDCSTEPAFEIDLEGTALVRSVEVVKLKSDVDRSLVGATVELVNVHGVVLRSFLRRLPARVRAEHRRRPGVTTVRLKGARRVDEDGRLLTSVCLTAAELRVRGCVDRYLVEDQRGCKCPPDDFQCVIDRPTAASASVCSALCSARADCYGSSYVEGSPSYCNLYKAGVELGATAAAGRGMLAPPARLPDCSDASCAQLGWREATGSVAAGGSGEAAVCATPTGAVPARARPTAARSVRGAGGRLCSLPELLAGSRRAPRRARAVSSSAAGRYAWSSSAEGCRGGVAVANGVGGFGARTRRRARCATRCCADDDPRAR